MKSLPFDLVRRRIPSDAVPKVCLKCRAKKIPKSVGARTHPCLTPLRMSKGHGGAAVELHSPFRICVEGFDHALKFWWAANLWKDLEETVSADKIKRLCEVNEIDIQGHLLLSALLLELAKGEDHVYC